jgi:hypothetical protein
MVITWATGQTTVHVIASELDHFRSLPNHINAQLIYNEDTPAAPISHLLLSIPRHEPSRSNHIVDRPELRESAT